MALQGIIIRWLQVQSLPVTNDNKTLVYSEKKRKKKKKKRFVEYWNELVQRRKLVRASASNQTHGAPGGGRRSGGWVGRSTKFNVAGVKSAEQCWRGVMLGREARQKHTKSLLLRWPSEPDSTLRQWTPNAAQERRKLWQPGWGKASIKTPRRCSCCE